MVLFHDFIKAKELSYMMESRNNLLPDNRVKSWRSDMTLLTVPLINRLIDGSNFENLRNLNNL